MLTQSSGIDYHDDRSVENVVNLISAKLKLKN